MPFSSHLDKLAPTIIGRDIDHDASFSGPASQLLNTCIDNAGDRGPFARDLAQAMLNSESFSNLKPSLLEYYVAKIPDTDVKRFRENFEFPGPVLRSPAAEPALAASFRQVLALAHDKRLRSEGDMWTTVEHILLALLEVRGGIMFQEAMEAAGSTVAKLVTSVSSHARRCATETLPMCDSAGDERGTMMNLLSFATDLSREAETGHIYPLAGREQSMREIEEWLDVARFRKIAITGPFGSGKTQLIKLFALRAMQTLPHRGKRQRVFEVQHERLRSLAHAGTLHEVVGAAIQELKVAKQIDMDFILFIGKSCRAKTIKFGTDGSDDFDTCFATSETRSAVTRLALELDVTVLITATTDSVGKLSDELQRSRDILNSYQAITLAPPSPADRALMAHSYAAVLRYSKMVILDPQLVESSLKLERSEHATADPLAISSLLRQTVERSLIPSQTQHGDRCTRANPNKVRTEIHALDIKLHHEDLATRYYGKDYECRRAELETRCRLLKKLENCDSGRYHCPGAHPSRLYEIEDEYDIERTKFKEKFGICDWQHIGDEADCGREIRRRVERLRAMDKAIKTYAVGGHTWTSSRRSTWNKRLLVGRRVGGSVSWEPSKGIRKRMDKSSAGGL